MKILFTGDELKGYTFSEMKDAETKYLGTCNSLNKQQSEIMLSINEFKPDVIVYEMEQYFDEAEEVASIIAGIKKASGIKVVLHVPTDNPNNIVNRACFDQGLYNLLPSTLNPTDKKTEFAKFFTDYYEKSGTQNELAEKIEEAKEKQRLEFNKFKTIAVVGVCHKIGTTTQCLQIVKYLEYKGYRACYVDASHNKYKNVLYQELTSDLTFPELIRYGIKEAKYNEEKNIVTYEGVDILMKEEFLTNTLKKEYDYFVYDYGVYNNRDFNKNGFLKDDIKFIIGGGFITEIHYVCDIIANISYKDSKILFNRVGTEKEKDDILDFMNATKNAERTYFIDFINNSFELANIDLYEQLLPFEERENAHQKEDTKKKKKKGFFRRK